MGCRAIKVEIENGKPVAYWPYADINDPQIEINSFYVYGVERPSFYLVTPAGDYVWLVGDGPEVIIKANYLAPGYETWFKGELPEWAKQEIEKFLGE